MSRSDILYLPLALLLSAGPFAAASEAVDGDLDTTFRDGGIFIYAVASQGGRAVEAADDGRLLIGYTAVLSGTDKDMRLLAVTDQGPVAPCGSYAPDLGGTDEDVLFDIAAWGTRIHLAGRAAGPEGDPSSQLAVAAVSLTDCDLETSFGGPQGYLWGSDAAIEARSLIVTPQGNVRYGALYGATTNGHLTTGGLNTAGFVDNGFDSELVNYAALGASAFEPHAMTRQPDGKLLVAGTILYPNGDRDVGVARFEDDGDPDSSWSLDGLVHFAYSIDDAGFTDEARAIAVLHDGRVVVAGSLLTGSGRRAAVALLTPIGGYVNDFGVVGRFVFPLTAAPGTHDDELRAVAAQGDGRIVVAGKAYVVGDADAGNFGVARLLTAGDEPFDPDFHYDGKRTIHFDYGGDLADSAWDLTLGQGGRISIAGAVATGGGTVIGAARLENSYIFVDGFEFGSPGFWSLEQP